MGYRRLLFALSILSPLAALACGGDGTPAAKASDEDAGADAGADATTDAASGSPTRERIVDAGTIPDAPPFGHPGTFCEAYKAVLDRCQDDGCKAANLAQCEQGSSLFSGAFKDAYVACAPTLACDASIDDSCIAAKVTSVPPTSAEAKFEADLSKACGVDAGRFELGPYLSDEIFAKADTTCSAKLATDSGADSCIVSGFYCAFGVFVEESPPSACRDE